MSLTDQKTLFEIQKFNNPPVFFTDRKKIANFASTINALPKNTIIIIREYDLDQQSRHDFAMTIAALAKKNKLRFLIGKDIALAKKIKANGVHFSDHDHLPLAFFNKGAFPKNFIFSLACHSVKSAITLLKNAKPDMLFLSPIFPTTSHLEAKTLKLKNLRILASKTRNFHYPTAFYALGGVKATNIRSIRTLKNHLPNIGFGAIDFFNKQTDNENNTNHSLRRLWNKIMAGFSQSKSKTIS